MCVCVCVCVRMCVGMLCVTLRFDRKSALLFKSSDTYEAVLIELISQMTGYYCEHCYVIIYTHTLLRE